MLEFLTQHQRGESLILSLLLAASACATRYRAHPGALNKIDSCAHPSLCR